MSVQISDDIVGKLRAAKVTAYENPEVKKVIAAQDEVLARYSANFKPAEIASISEETLRSFLYFENNKHWSGLFRQVNRICADMNVTRAALAELVDETRPLETRLEASTAIKCMGKGIITAILHVAYPQTYGVWNNTSEAALVKLGLMPVFERGADFGERYAAINDVLRAAAEAIDVDLWTLDALWWSLASPDVHPIEDGAEPDLGPGPSSPNRSFALERHLHDYLFDNWENLSLAREWEIYALPGDPEAGYEFSTPIGRIDLLARHKTEPKWLVIELKRQSSADQVIGQTLRYMGWIKKHHAKTGETVEGLIVASEGDDKLHYALSVAGNVRFMAYEVEFHLKPGPTLDEVVAR